MCRLLMGLTEARPWVQQLAGVADAPNRENVRGRCAAQFGDVRAPRVHNRAASQWWMA